MDKYLILPDLVKRGYLYKALEKGDLKGELIIPWRAMNKLISEEQNEFYREKNIRELERVKRLADEGRIKIRYIDDEVGNDLEAIHNVSDKYEAVVATSDEIITHHVDTPQGGCGAPRQEGLPRRVEIREDRG